MMHQGTSNLAVMVVLNTSKLVALIEVEEYLISCLENMIQKSDKWAIGMFQSRPELYQKNH
jgi:hypothetical protein